jgi:hypothetical protein
VHGCGSMVLTEKRARGGMAEWFLSSAQHFGLIHVRVMTSADGASYRVLRDQERAEQ